MTAPAWALNPTLEPAPGGLPATMQAGERGVFRLIYRDPKNSRPRDLTMVVEPPGGATVRRPPEQMPRSGNFKDGVTVDWTFLFDRGGTYRIYWEAASVDGKPGRPETRWPPTAHLVTVVNPFLQWTMLGVGLVVALLLLPMGLFFLLRGMSRQLDPGAVARLSLVAGILAAVAWYGILFWPLHSLPTLAAVALVALVAAFLVTTMRK